MGPAKQRVGRDAGGAGLRALAGGVRRAVRERATRCGERAATRARAGPRGGVGRAAGQAGRPERGKGKRDERVGPASWAVGLVTGTRWFGVWAPFLTPFLFYFFSFLNLILIQTQGK